MTFVRILYSAFCDSGKRLVTPKIVHFKPSKEEINEAINCERMQRLYPFPYHVLLEVSGLMSFALLAHMFYVWQARQI